MNPQDSARQELRSKLRKIWDMDSLEATFCNELPLTLKEMGKAIEESIDLILEDRRRICEPLIEFRKEGHTSGLGVMIAIGLTLKNAGY